MKRKFPPNEAAMYPVIKDYFLRSLNCDYVCADRDEKYVRLSKNSRIRRVDVVALSDPNGADPRVDLVEAKLFARGDSFDACVNQLDSIRDSGDRLWAAFSEDEWESLTDADRRRNERKLSDHQCGLLLVSEANCLPRIKAPHNADVTKAGRSEVLQQLGFAKELIMPNVETLGNHQDISAGGIMALMCLIGDILFELEHRKADLRAGWDSAQDLNFILHGWYVPIVDLTGQVICELDPFGRLLKDGFPTVWVEVELPLGGIFARL